MHAHSRDQFGAHRYLLALRRGAKVLDVHLEADGSGGYLDNGPRLPKSIMEEITCGQPHRLLIADRKGNPLYLGRTSREPSRRQRRALAIRAHNRCEAPGCDKKRFLHAHHVRHWTNGGGTKLTNLILLCGRHHRLVHEGGYGVEALGAHVFAFFDPAGRVLPQCPEAALAAGPGLVERNRAAGVAVTDDSCRSLTHAPKDPAWPSPPTT